LLIYYLIILPLGEGKDSGDLSADSLPDFTKRAKLTSVAAIYGMLFNKECKFLMDNYRAEF